MNLRELYEKAIAVGVDHDPRGQEEVRRSLQLQDRTYRELPQKEQEFFDRESLGNPYADSRILHGTGDEDVQGMLVGIDVEVGEVLLAENLRRTGRPVTGIIAHHPEGTAYANLYTVMHMQSDILSRFGVPINIAEDLMEGRVREVERRLMPMNHTRAVDAARLLDIPFMCLHTPADNMVVSFLQKLCDEKKPETLSEVIDLLMDIPEYRSAARTGCGPKILMGAKTRRAGRIFVDMTGGTEGSKDIFGSLTSAGVNTILAMHLSEEHRKEAEKNHLNVVIAGHISSDNLGVNLLLDEVLKGADIAVLGCSGYTRVIRNP